MAKVKSDKKIKVRLILPGGGTRAAFQIGFVTEMMKSGMFDVDHVYGCSAGALLAPLVVTNKMDLLIRDLEGIKTMDDLAEPWTYLPTIPGVRNPFASMYNGLQRILGPNAYVFKFFSIVHLYFDLGLYKRLTMYDRIIGYLTSAEKKIVEKKCTVAAFDVVGKKSVYFSGKDVIPGIQASSALWLFVPPVKYKGKWYTDGGVTSRYPIDNLNLEWDGLYIMVDPICDHEVPSTQLPPNMVVYLYDLVSSVMGEYEADQLKDVQGKLKNRFISIYPDETYLTSGLDVNEKRIMRAMNQGRIKFHDFVLKNLAVLVKHENRTRSTS
jgi:predicted acylesterase/phospholipase RssA